MAKVGERGFVKGAGSSRMAVLMPFTLRELHRNRRFRMHLAGLLAAIAFFSYIGPFGTAATLDPAERILYWSLSFLLNWLIGFIVFSVAIRSFMAAGRPGWIGVIVGAVVAAVPGTGTVVAVEALFGRGFATVWHLLYLYSCVAVIMLVVGFLVHRLIEHPLHAGVHDEGQSAEGPSVTGAPFLDRLPSALGRELLHLHMRDHYVEACTSRGSDLILLRFGDALKEVAPLDGMQVHRSHWVAAAAVEGTHRRGSRTFLTLVNGSEVPVSRSRIREIRERGWI